MTRWSTIRRSCLAPGMTAVLALSAGCLVGEGGDSELGESAAAAPEVQAAALFPEPTKAEIDAFAMANGFPDSDYPYYERTNGCGSGWSTSIVPDGLPRFKPKFIPLTGLPWCGRLGSKMSDIDFTDACNAHDHCYITAGKSKADCDRLLYDRMIDACNSALKTTPMLPCAYTAPTPPGIISGIITQPNVKGDLPSLERCHVVASYYWDAVALAGGEYFNPSQVKAKQYAALVQQFITEKKYGVCVDGLSCGRSPTIVHRLGFTCDGAYTSEDTIDLREYIYSNYKCGNRYQEQCVDDGTRDGFFMEWCEYGTPQCRSIPGNLFACDPGATPGTNCRPTKLHRRTYSCNGTLQIPEEVIDLATYGNYTCNNRFMEHCLDGSWDSYQSEWCEYSCS